MARKPKAEFQYDGVPGSLSSIKKRVREDLTKDLVSATEAAAKLGVTTVTLRQWREERKVAAIKSGKMWYYSREDLLNLVRHL